MKINSYAERERYQENRTTSSGLDRLTASVARLRLSNSSSLNLYRTPFRAVRDVRGNRQGSFLMQPSKEMFEKNALEQIKVNPSTFQRLGKEYQENRTFILSAIRENPFVLFYLEPRYKEDEEIVLLAAKIDINALKHAGPELKSSGDFFVKVVTQQKQKLKENYFKRREHEELVLVGCEGDEISSYEVKMLRSGFEFANENLRSNTELVRTLVGIYGATLRDTTPILQNDQTTVQIAVMEDPVVYAFASKELQDNKEYVLKLLDDENDDENIDFIFPFLSKRLRGDVDVVKTACKSTDDGEPEQYLSDDARDSEEYFLQLHESCKIEGTYTELASARLRSMPEFMLRALSYDIDNLAYADSSLLSDRKFMLKAVSKEIESLEYADSPLLNSMRFMLTAIQIKPKSVVYIGEKLRRHKRFMETLKWKLSELSKRKKLYSELKKYR